MAANPDAVAAISSAGINDALAGKMRALVQNIAEGVAARPTKLAEILTADRSSINDSEQQNN